MRRNEYNITDRKEIDQFLNDQAFGVLSLIDLKGLPYSVPMNYFYVNRKIILHGALEGKKYDLIKNNNNVHFVIFKEYSFIPFSFCGEKSFCSNSQFYKSVMIKGKADIISKIREKLILFQQIKNIVGKKHRDIHAHTSHLGLEAVNRTVVIVINADNVSAKFKFGQNLKTEIQKLIKENLKKRGMPIDLETIEMMNWYCRD